MPDPGRISTIVSLIDVLPTITAALDLPLPVDQFEGIDIFSEEREYALAEREHTLRFGEELSLALISEKWKYRYYSASPDVLFDLVRDPWEVQNVIHDHSEVAETMKKELLRLVDVGEQRGLRLDIKTGEDRQEYRDTLEALRKLGYVR